MYNSAGIFENILIHINKILINEGSEYCEMDHEMGVDNVGAGGQERNFAAGGVAGMGCVHGGFVVEEVEDLAGGDEMCRNATGRDATDRDATGRDMADGDGDSAGGGMNGIDRADKNRAVSVT